MIRPASQFKCWVLVIVLAGFIVLKAAWGQNTNNVTGYLPITLTNPGFKGNAGLFFNKNLQIAGGYKGDPNAFTGEDAPFLWQNYQYHHLEDFFPGLSNYAKFQVKGIDDNGVITAIATPNATSQNPNPNQQIVQLAPIAIQRRIADQTNYAPLINSAPLGNNVVVAGQFIDLKLVDLSNTFPISNVQWVIDGTTFKSYTANNSAATLTQLASTDLTNQTVQFFWADSGKKNVVCKYNSGQNQEQASFTFTVVAPTNAKLTRPVSRALVTTTGNYYFGEPNVILLHNGGASSDTVAGMTTTYTYTPIPSSSSSYPVDMEVVQLITPSRQVKIHTTQQVLQWSLNGTITQVLDGQFPYVSYPHTSTTLTAHDSPGQPVDPFDDNNPPSTDQAKVNNETFDVWLMFRSLQGNPGVPVDPNNPSTISACWVPLRHFTWTWSGEAGFSNGSWTNSAANASAPQPSADQPTSVQPQWSNNVNNLQFQ